MRFDNVDWTALLFRSLKIDRSEKSKQTLFVFEPRRLEIYYKRRTRNRWSSVFSMVKSTPWFPRILFLLASCNSIEFLYNRFQVNWTLGKLISPLGDVSLCARYISYTSWNFFSPGTRGSVITREKRIDSIILASLAFDFRISRILERVVYCLHPEFIPSVLGADRKILRIVG